MKVIAFIGPAGSGKTTLASHTAQHFGVPFVDGDSYYPLHIREKIENSTDDIEKDLLQLSLVYKPLISKVKTLFNQNQTCIISHSFKKHLFRNLFDMEFGKNIVWVLVIPDQNLHIEKLFMREWEDPNRTVHHKVELRNRLEQRTIKYWAELDLPETTPVIKIQNNYDQSSIEQTFRAISPLLI